jgi:hypothetical protein
MANEPIVVDKEIRQYLLATAVILLMALGSCSSVQLYARLDRTEAKVDILQKDMNTGVVSDAVLKKDIDDFHKATDLQFEAIKQLLREDFARHHK